MPKLRSGSRRERGPVVGVDDVPDATVRLDEGFYPGNRWPIVPSAVVAREMIEPTDDLRSVSDTRVNYPPGTVHSAQARLAPSSTRPPARLLHSEQTLLYPSHRTSVQFGENQSTANIVESLRTGRLPTGRPGEALIVNPETGVIMQGNTRVWILGRRHGLTPQQVVDIIEGRAPIPSQGAVGPGPGSARQRFDDLFRD
jgi:hypothetical protein